MTANDNVAQASIATADNLRTIAHALKSRQLSHLSIPEVDAAVELVGQLVPAGNVPGVILNGLARLPDRTPPIKNVKRDIGLLFKGVEQVLDKAVFKAFFQGPGMIISGYQNLLKLAGKDLDASFPEGTWQFYVDYALREDTARHANETHGFDTTLTRHGITLNAIDRVTAWTMAVIYCLHQYSALLQNEWRERVHTALLAEVTKDNPEASKYARAYGDWSKQRPYSRGTDSTPEEDYPTYRYNKFNRFMEEALGGLSDEAYRTWHAEVSRAEEHDLPRYLRQMSILSYLEPGPYDETRTLIDLEHAHVGLIYQGHYYLISACSPGTRAPADVTTVRSQIAALMTHPSEAPPTHLTRLVEIKRSSWPHMRRGMDENLLRALDTLRLAPIIYNTDRQPRSLPLAELRQTERGTGSHALTIFDTHETFVFDQSHIYFDGAWGAALAEIMTNEALAWAVYLNSLPPVQAQPGAMPPLINCQFAKGDLDLIEQAPAIIREVGAETEAVNVKEILKLRKQFKQRNDLIRLTVNDLLVLYRAIHAVTYKPAADLVSKVQRLANDPQVGAAARQALQELTEYHPSPAILIPVDASQRDPAERLYPMTFEVPLNDLNLIDLHAQTLTSLAAYQGGRGDRSVAYKKFNQTQRDYLAALAGFGQVLTHAKNIAITGESASVGSIKMLAHMPQALQRLLDQIPGKFDVLNDIIKGREVFSNVGVVAPTSTLTRFITAKDDNEKKTLAWGVITDATGVMRITLRDFRPHVGMLIDARHKDLAVRIADDYLNSYAHGLNEFVRDLQRITTSSRETRLQRPGQDT